jgi:hypothetical protein
MKSNWVTGRTNLRRWGATSSAAGSAASACSNQRKYGLSPQANIPNKNRSKGGKGWRRTARCAERRRKRRTACRTLLQAAACRLQPAGSRALTAHAGFVLRQLRGSMKGLGLGTVLALELKGEKFQPSGAGNAARRHRVE